jgi:hypothetical protein
MRRRVEQEEDREGATTWSTAVSPLRRDERTNKRADEYEREKEEGEDANIKEADGARRGPSRTFAS